MIKDNDSILLEQAYSQVCELFNTPPIDIKWETDIKTDDFEQYAAEFSYKDSLVELTVIIYNIPSLATLTGQLELDLPQDISQAIVDAGGYAEISFAVNEQTWITNETGKDAFKIFAWIMSAFLDFFNSRPDIKCITFSSDKSEQSRSSLYTKFAKHFGPQYKVHKTTSPGSSMFGTDEDFFVLIRS